MGKAIVVTGGLGFIGSHLCLRLLKDGHKVMCLDDLSTGQIEHLGMFDTYPNFKFIRHDIADPIFFEDKVDEIYNLACPASPVHYQHNPVKTTQTSVVGTMNMLELARIHGCKILQASTSEVYGDPKEHPQRESYYGNVNINGIRSCYDEGKRCAESLCLDYHRQFAVRVKIIRIFNINEISPQTKVLIRVNIDKTNMDDFVDLYKLIQSKQYHNTYISPAFVDDISQQNMNPCIFNQTDKAEFIKGLLIKYNLDFSLLYPSGSRHECAVRNPFSVVIGPEGELYKCWNDVGNKNRIYGYLNGTITNESVLLDYLMRADPFEDKKCRRCKFIPVCSGGCPYNRLAIMKNSSKETSCLIQKNYLKTFLSLHYNSKKSID